MLIYALCSLSGKADIADVAILLATLYGTST